MILNSRCESFLKTGMFLLAFQKFLTKGTAKSKEGVDNAD